MFCLDTSQLIIYLNVIDIFAYIFFIIIFKFSTGL